MTDSIPVGDRVCPQCQAKLEPGSQQCWLCGAAIGEPTQKPAAKLRPSQHAGLSFSLSTLMLVTTLVAICCGLLVILPGLGVIAAIILAPVLVRTSMVVKRREAAGKSVSPGQKISLAVTSFAVTCVIAAVVAVASVGTFCGVCFGEFVLLDSLNPQETWPLVIAIWGIPIVAALAVTIPIVRWLNRWVRARFQRDITGDGNDEGEIR